MSAMSLLRHEISTLVSEVDSMSRVEQSYELTPPMMSPQSMVSQSMAPQNIMYGQQPYSPVSYQQPLQQPYSPVSYQQPVQQPVQQPQYIYVQQSQQPLQQSVQILPSPPSHEVPMQSPNQQMYQQPVSYVQQSHHPQIQHHQLPQQHQQQHQHQQHQPQPQPQPRHQPPVSLSDQPADPYDPHWQTEKKALLRRIDMMEEAEEERRHYDRMEKKKLAYELEDAAMREKEQDRVFQRERERESRWMQSPPTSNWGGVPPPPPPVVTTTTPTVSYRSRSSSSSTKTGQRHKSSKRRRRSRSSGGERVYLNINVSGVSNPLLLKIRRDEPLAVVQERLPPHFMLLLDGKQLQYTRSPADYYWKAGDYNTVFLNAVPSNGATRRSPSRRSSRSPSRRSSRRPSLGSVKGYVKTIPR